MALRYEGTDVRRHRYIDSDFVSEVDSQRSTTGYVFTLGGGAISWAWRLQKIVVLSTIEIGYDSNKSLQRLDMAK